MSAALGTPAALTVPVPVWAKRAVDEWTTAAGINDGTIFRRVSRLGKIWGDRITPKAIWHVVRAAANRASIKSLAPHDLRRTGARLCHLAGGELEQIQYLPGHASVQTTERYLGFRQKLSQAAHELLATRRESRSRLTNIVYSSYSSDPSIQMHD